MKRDGLTAAPWNVNLPADWQRRLLKYCARMKGRLGWQNLRADEYTDEGPFLVTSEHFKDDKVDWDRCYHVTEERYAMAPEIQLRTEDVFFMKDGAAMGKLAYVATLPGPACLNSHLLLFRPRRGEFTTRFLYYVLRSPLFQEFIATEATGTTFQGISQESVGKFPMPLPAKPTQRAIAAFLDRETGRIDALVAKKRELIERLKEKRTALISRTVTRGLPPAAARTAGLPEDPPLKPSGIEWIGDVSKHWGRASKLARLASRRKHSFVNGPFGSDLLTSEITDEGVPVVYIRDISAGHYRRTSEGCVTPEKAKELNFCRVDPGDVLVAKVGDPPGAAAVYPASEPSGIVTQDVIRIRVDESRVSPSYVAYFLNSSAGRSLIDQIAIESTRMRVSLGDYKSCLCVLPPLFEQAAIAAYLDKETATLDALVGKVEEAVERLQEYRTALITAAVTGKIDVRAANPNEIEG